MLHRSTLMRFAVHQANEALQIFQYIISQDKYRAGGKLSGTEGASVATHHASLSA